MEEVIVISESQGVGPTSRAALDPRQERFIRLYFDAGSDTFGNCYQSAVQAGYSDQTARNLTHNRPVWLSEKLGQIKAMDPESLLLKLTNIIDSDKEATQNKLRAIDMMMRHYRMFGVVQADMRINIESVLD